MHAFPPHCSDFGAPNLVNWDWPLLPEHPTGPGDFDIPNGWAVRERSWAIITAGQNMVETAAQMSGGVDPAQVQAPSDQSTDAERAWNTFLPALTSGYTKSGAAIAAEVGMD